MPNYRYEAEGRDGRKTSGEITAASRERALAQLSAAGLRSIRVAEAPIDAGEGVDAEIVPDAEQLSLSDAVDLSALISGLASSGLPLDAGLKAAALEMPKSTLARTLLAVSRRLAEGAPLDQAVASQGNRFPPHVRGLVFAGLRSGRLATVLEEFVSLEHRAAELHRQIALTLAYPAILISLLCGIFTFFAVAVFPSLSKILDDFDIMYSMPTQIAVGFSDAGMYALLGNMAVIFGVWLLMWLSSDLPELRSMLKSFPLLGPIARWAALSRFVRLLALLLESRLPLAESLRMAGEGSRDAELSIASRKAAGAIEDGRSLDESLALHSAFPRSLGPIVVWGHRAAALPEALRMASEMFDGRLQSQLGLLRTAVPALTFLIVLWGIFFLIAAVLFPMIGLIEKLT
jgi:type II secretory pathway component PulF